MNRNIVDTQFIALNKKEEQVERTFKLWQMYEEWR
jgi:hypothetical protein